MMKKKRKLFMILACGCLLSAAPMQVRAQSGELNITQRVSKLADPVQEQEYTFSYLSDGTENYSGGVRMELSFPNGFTANTLRTGNWAGYDGNLVVSVYQNGGALAFRTAAGEGSDVDLSSYPNAKQITIEPESRAVTSPNVSDLRLLGRIDAAVAGDSLGMTGIYYGSADGTAYDVLSSQTIVTDCKVYRLDPPALTVDNSILDYLGNAQIALDGIKGSGDVGASKVNLTVSIPERMLVESVTLPEFQNASLKLFVNGRECDLSENHVYINSTATSFLLEVTPEAGELLQISPMLIQMRNISTDATGDGGTLVGATVQAVLEDGSQQEAASEALRIHCNAGETEPVEPPVNPDEGGNPSGGSSGGSSGGNHDGSTNAGKKPVGPADGKDVPPSIVDFSGLNLQSSRAFGNDAASASLTQSDKQRTGNLKSALSDRVQSARVFDFDDEETEKPGTWEKAEQKPAKSIKKSQAEKTKESVKEAVRENRFLPIACILCGVAALGGIIAYCLLHRKQEETEDELMDEDDVS